MARALMIAALVALAVSSAAAAGGATTTVTSLSWTDADGATDFFDGAISSEKHGCLRHRRVVLRRKENGPDPRIAAAKTDRKGKFVIEREDPGSGKYWVTARRAPGCQSAESGLLAVSDLEDV